jgi:hypothetical protein
VAAACKKPSHLSGAETGAETKAEAAPPDVPTADDMPGFAHQGPPTGSASDDQAGAIRRISDGRGEQIRSEASTTDGAVWESTSHGGTLVAFQATAQQLAVHQIAARQVAAPAGDREAVITLPRLQAPPPAGGTDELAAMPDTGGDDAHHQAIAAAVIAEFAGRMFDA